MPQNLVQKIFASRHASGRFRLGEDIGLRVDQTLLQDATGTMACLQLEQLGVERVRVPFAIAYVDHNILSVDEKNADDHLFLKTFCARTGIYYSRPGNGICHYLHLERFARPGQVLIGADSHTTMAGALGMVAIGAGGLDVAVVMAGQPFVLETPRVVNVRLEGERLPEWVQAKDIILELLRRRTVRGGRGCMFEFTGPGVRALSATQRGTICNMIAELGATGGIFPSDERTREWLMRQRRVEEWTPLEADPGAAYDEEEIIRLEELEPLIALPHSPDNVRPVREVADAPVRQVNVGSSVNSGYDDLAIVGEVLRDRTVSPETFFTVTPGSRQILDTIVASGTYRALLAAGARILEPACGPCVGMGQAPPTGAISVRTFNRNFPGRSGTPNDQVYLCSPAVAAATALTGVITDPRTLGKEPPLPAAPADPSVDDRNILAPAPPEEARRIEIVRGPNIKPPPPQFPLPEEIADRVLIVLGDDISTGDLAPDGAVVMAFRSNVEAIANFTLRRADPDFPSRARSWGGGIIVAGHNYGQGSSREHAALAPRALGVRAVIAKSFARIHRRNLITQGIPPLAFKNEADYERALAGDTWVLPGVRAALEEGVGELRVRVQETGDEFTVRTLFSQREIEVLLAGGLIALLKRGGRNLSAGTADSGVADQGSPFTNPMPDETVK